MWVSLFYFDVKADSFNINHFLLHVANYLKENEDEYIFSFQGLCDTYGSRAPVCLLIWKNKYLSWLFWQWHCFSCRSSKRNHLIVSKCNKFSSKISYSTRRKKFPRGKRGNCWIDCSNYSQGYQVHASWNRLVLHFQRFFRKGTRKKNYSKKP